MPTANLPSTASAVERETLRERDVLFVTRKFPPVVGGMENLSAEYARSLEVAGHPKVIALRRSQRNLVWFLPIAAARSLLALIVERVGTVLVGDALMLVALWPVLMLRRVRVVVIVHGLDLTFPHWWYRALVRRALRRANVVVANSRATGRAAEALGVDPARIEIVLPCLAVPSLGGIEQAEARATIVRTAGLAADDVILVTLGRLVRRKGQAWFVAEVLPKLPARFMDVVGGSGPDHDTIVEVAERAGVDDRVVLLGVVDDFLREALLVGADVFVVPNIDVPGDMEGFGIVAAEAEMRGAPVVAARLEGLLDAVIDGELAATCEPADAAGFAAAIAGLINRGVKPEARIAAAEIAAARFGPARFDREVAGIARAAASQPTEPAREARSHAVLDPESRRRKARKLIAIIERRRAPKGASVLEVGTGSGVIASALAAAVGTSGVVCSVDVRDERIEREGYEFSIVTDTRLPFPDNAFDVVISNHVYEHVGNRREQMRHFVEIERVLRPDGIVYFAVPNRRGLFEPHYRLPLLSWLPPGAADAYVRATRGGDRYDVVLPTRETVLRFANEAGFDAEECSIEAARVLAEVEDPSIPVRLLGRAPESVLKLGLPIVPTMVFVLHPRPAVGASRAFERKTGKHDRGE
jgi:phosphatidylinositol alpha-1,6-mannosyltransferase